MCTARRVVIVTVRGIFLVVFATAISPLSSPPPPPSYCLLAGSWKVTLTSTCRTCASRTCGVESPSF